MNTNPVDRNHPESGPAPVERQLRSGNPALRRTLFFTAVATTVAVALAAMLDILGANGLEPLEIAILALFFVNFTWIALSFWTAIAGFAIEALGLDPVGLSRRARIAFPLGRPLHSRTAVVMPVCNEEPESIFARLQAIYQSVAATGHLDHFHFYLLSGSTRDETVAGERRQWQAFCRRLGADGRMFYWKRDERAGRKAGTVADFCRRWGAYYEHMVMLDADSLMSGRLLVELARRMEANPGVGLIQTQPLPLNQTTLFARILQFAGHLYGPVFASGATFWQLGESNYYGHNAIIRTAAFTRSCGLPELPGRPPLGGEILSHDFVEAALLRRAGWQVYFLPTLPESYEELPTNLIDFAARDRRWCQGNLQHLKLVGAPGLHPLSRLHFLSGAFAFLASPQWLLFLVLSTAAIVSEAVGSHDYFPGGYRLFPEWPISKWTETVSLFTVTLSLLFLPKLFGLVLALADRGRRREFGGGWRLAGSAFGETLFAVLTAPVMMALHSYFVACLVSGFGVGWGSQNRSGRSLAVGEAFSSLAVLFLAALVWGGLILVAAPERVWWILPVLTGLIVAVPAAVVSSRATLGERLRRRGWFLTPEETAPSPVVEAAAEALVATQAVAGQPPAESAEKKLPPGPPPPIPTPMPAQVLRRRLPAEDRPPPQRKAAG
jgi:membrane glycosyltransferase